MNGTRAPRPSTANGDVAVAAAVIAASADGDAAVVAASADGDAAVVAASADGDDHQDDRLNPAATTAAAPRAATPPAARRRARRCRAGAPSPWKLIEPVPPRQPTATRTL
ncbi:hypothetical protein GCM10010435_79460 [Winogradskya consettensis]|uniref:Uncharacterized protein n=1 Tax=Winogradskya consettensis TaxID=113560 RepID=A0A919VSR4_9ACTN|nr:hypothetical protein Aco04nite_55500 [Actinoplanes consettensis]